jgi:tetratricopeptide (TPR) repeat protein
LERSVQITEQIGNPWQFCVWNGALGLQRFIGGAWQEARYRLTLSLSAGEHSRMAYPLWQMGWLDLAEGRWAEAAELLDQSIAIGGRTGNLQVLRFASGLLAELDLVQGQPAAARERLLPLLDRLGLLELDVTFLLPRLAWAELEMGEVERATVLSADAVDRARRQRYHLVLADALRVQGSVLEASNKHDEASSALQEALDVCHSVSYPYAEARALYEWGVMEIRQGNPAKAREWLQAALAIFRRLGARPSIERTEQALLLVTDGKARLA